MRLKASFSCKILSGKLHPLIALGLSAVLTGWLLRVPVSAAQQTAQSMAAKVDRHYNGLRSLRVDFTQGYDGMGQHRRESGVLLLKKPGKMRWDYTTPAGKLFVLDGREAYFYTPGQTEVQRIPAKKLDDLRSPLRFLLGHAELTKEIPGLKIASDGPDFVLSGVPRNMEQRISSLAFTVTGEGMIRAIKVEEPDGSVSRFTFSNEQPNAEEPDSEFVFRAPPGSVVVEGMPPE